MIWAMLNEISYHINKDLLDNDLAQLVHFVIHSRSKLNDEKCKLALSPAKLHITSLNLNFTLQNLAPRYGGLYRLQ